MQPKKLTRRDFLRLTSITAAGATLAACAPKATEAPAEPPAVEPTEAAAPAAEAPAVKEDITLVGFSKEGDVADGMKVCADLIKEMTGVTLEVQSAPEDQFRAKVTADFAAGGGAYDVIFMPYNMMREFYELGHLLPMGDYIAKDSSINLDDFGAALLKEYGGWGGDQYALPWKADVYVAFHRKDVFEDAAMQDMFKSRTGMELKPPQTVEEQIAIAEFFTKSFNPDSPLEYGWTNWSERWGSIWWWGARLSALGGGFLDENNHPNFNNEAGLRAMQDYLTLHKFAPADVATYEWSKANLSFLDGSSAMFDEWNSFGTECNTPEGYWGKSEVVGKTGFGVLSGYEVGGALKQASVLGGWCGSIPKYTKDPQAAYEVIAALTSTEAELLREPIGHMPTRTSTLEKLEPKLTTEHYPATQANFAVASIGADVFAPPIGQQLQDFLATTVNATIQGQYEPEEALQLIEDEWTKNLKDAGIYG